MIKPLKLYLAGKRYRSKNISYRGTTDFELRSLIILFDEKNIQIRDNLEQLKSEFNISEGKFKAVCCGSCEVGGERSIRFKFDDISYNGKLKDKTLEEAITSGPDLVINYAEKLNPEAGFLMELLAAPVIAGRYDEGKINLSIKDGNDPEIFTKELIRYLKILKGE